MPPKKKQKEATEAPPEVENTSEKRGRSQRAAKTKPKVWESLVPKPKSVIKSKSVQPVSKQTEEKPREDDKISVDKDSECVLTTTRQRRKNSKSNTTAKTTATLSGKRDINRNSKDSNGTPTPVNDECDAKTRKYSVKKTTKQKKKKTTSLRPKEAAVLSPSSATPKEVEAGSCKPDRIVQVPAGAAESTVELHSPVPRQQVVDRPVAALSGKKRLERETDILAELEVGSPCKRPRTAASPRKSKIAFKSLASSVSQPKMSTFTRKIEPRKTICNIDILNLLSDPEDEQEDNDKEEIEPTAAPVRKSPCKSYKQKVEDSIGDQKKVPIWRKMNASKLDTTPKDVYNADKYGEEEFGPEAVDQKKKKTRKKKKDTKAILQFGDKESKVVRDVVKDAYNVKTPGVRKTRKCAPKKADKQAKIPISFYKSFQSPPSVQPEVQQTSIVESAEDLQSEFTVDVQENFSAPEPEPPRRSPRKPLGICNKYLTPEVPKKIKSRLDKGSSSTPNLQPSREAPQTIKELINCAFGFESEDDLEESANESISISPVKKVTNPVLAMFGNDSVLAGQGSSRLSTLSRGTIGGFSGTSRLSSSTRLPTLPVRAPLPILTREPRRKGGPFRINLQPAGPTVEQKLLAQVKDLKLKAKSGNNEINKKPRVGRRASPRKPLHSSTLLTDMAEIRKPRNAHEMLMEADRNKMVSKRLMEESSLYEDPSTAHEEECPSKASKTDKPSETIEKTSDKENSQVVSPVKPVKITNNRVYKKKNVREKEKNSELVTTFDESSSTMKKTPKKDTKKERVVNQWAKLQSSHFEEVDDFDLSFI